jgi:hypothetical protein
MASFKLRSLQVLRRRTHTADVHTHQIKADVSRHRMRATQLSVHPLPCSTVGCTFCVDTRVHNRAVTNRYGMHIPTKNLLVETLCMRSNVDHTSTTICRAYSLTERSSLRSHTSHVTVYEVTQSNVTHSDITPRNVTARILAQHALV